MEVIVFGLKNCDSCRKALKALPEARLVDVRVDGVPASVLQQAFDTFGAALLNTRSTTWRGLDPAEREQDTLALINAHPTLMKRPLIQVQDRLFLSWNSDVEEKVKASL